MSESKELMKVEQQLSKLRNHTGVRNLISLPSFSFQDGEGNMIATADDAADQMQDLADRVVTRCSPILKEPEMIALLNNVAGLCAVVRRQQTVIHDLNTYLSRLTGADRTESLLTLWEIMQIPEKELWLGHA